jgi:ElaB/YqjD/DUF883 family membrane-anchored ribosome-binding protein
MSFYMTDVYGDVAARLWRATARAAAHGMNPAKTAAHKAAVHKAQERRMTTTDGYNDKERRDTTATDRVAARAHETVDTIAERAQRAEREVRDAAARTAQQARELHEQYAETAEQGLRRAASYLESNPLAFVGIAFVAGVLLSTMIRR